MKMILLGFQELSKELLSKLQLRYFRVLHDFDYERHPTSEEHPFVGVDYLRKNTEGTGNTLYILTAACYTSDLIDTVLRSIYSAACRNNRLVFCADVTSS